MSCIDRKLLGLRTEEVESSVAAPGDQNSSQRRNRKPLFDCACASTCREVCMHGVADRPHMPRSFFLRLCSSV